MSDYKSFGAMNGWSKTPIEVHKCWDLEHDLDRVEIRRCVTEYTCPICKIKYKIDTA